MLRYKSRTRISICSVGYAHKISLCPYVLPYQPSNLIQLIHQVVCYNNNGKLQIVYNYTLYKNRCCLSPKAYILLWGDCDCDKNEEKINMTWKFHDGIKERNANYLRNELNEKSQPTLLSISKIFTFMQK